jgi:hypothetical protein
MSLLAEVLVEEWLNRKGFFTIRGIKDGVDEVDLLGVRKTKSGYEGWHIEAQVSFRPVSYVTKLTDSLAKKLNKKKTSAWERPPDVLKECVRAWIEQKYTCPKKASARSRLWSDLSWKYHFVHGNVKYVDELVEIESYGIKLVPFQKVLEDICNRTDPGFPGAAGSDIADIVDFYEKQMQRAKA